jgi:organic hydroperoxide reductase OsmC/OhrA
LAGRQHHYRVTVEWTGNHDSGTRNYAGYSRNHTVTAGTKAPIEGSSDPAFRGDPSRWNPEELLLASISACHKLWYLHLCSDAGISVVSYRDEPEATMIEEKTSAGHFIKATLRPSVTIEPGGDAEKARALHIDAHRFCFIANSVNFPIECEPVIVVAG